MDANPIRIDQENHQQPALLAMNHPIRHEAAKIYYRQNCFIICLPDFDPTAMITFRQHSRVYSSSENPPRMSFDDEIFLGGLSPRPVVHKSDIGRAIG